MLKNFGNDRKKLKLLIFYLLNKKAKRVDPLFFLFFFFKNNFLSFNQKILTDTFYKKVIVTGLIPEENDENQYATDDELLCDNPCLREYGWTFLPNLRKQHVVFNGPINFLRLKRGLLSQKRLDWTEIMMSEYHELTEGPLDYRDPYCLKMFEFKLNAEGNYVLEPVEEKKAYSRYTGDSFEENENTRGAHLENESKLVINSNVKTFLYFFHKLPSLFYKKKINKFLLLKKLSYSRKLKNKIFKYLVDENNIHPISFLKNVLSNYKVSFDGLEEEYLYTSFDSLRNLKFSSREVIFFLSIEGFFDEYKLNDSVNIDDKEEIINSSDSVSSKEKNVYTLDSKFSARIKELKKNKKVDINSMPYNLKIVSVNDGRTPKNIEDKSDDVKINSFLKDNLNLLESITQGSGAIDMLKNEGTKGSFLINSLNTDYKSNVIEKKNQSADINNKKINKTFDDLINETKETQNDNFISILTDKNDLKDNFITNITENKITDETKSCTEKETLVVSNEALKSNNDVLNNETKSTNNANIKEEQKTNIPKAQFNENFIYKLDLINEDWENLFDNYNYFLFKKEKITIKNKNLKNFFFFWC